MTTFPLRRILVGVDLSTCSRAALAFACRLAEPARAKVEVLMARGARDGEALSYAAKTAAEELHRFVLSVPETRGTSITERVETGDPREWLVTSANDGFDAIVVGTHGRTGRPHSLAGSVAESVVRTAHCPVVTVREQR